MNGVINGGKLIGYLDGKPIEATTNPVLLITDEYEKGLTFTEGEHSFTFESLQSYDPFDDPEYCKSWIWQKIQSLPRKKKKRIKRLLEKGYTMSVTIR